MAGERPHEQGRGGPGGDEPLERLAGFARSRGEEGRLPKGLIARALRQKDRLEGRGKRPPRRPPRDPGAGGGGGPAPSPPGPAGSVNWTPLGPSAVGYGPPQPEWRFAGRVRGLAAGPGSSRVYAGAANGGAWFSGDSGHTWKALDDYFVSPSLTPGRESDALSVGSLAVAFGASAATDVVYVGTGEIWYGNYFGVGIRRSPSGGSLGSWSLEATNLAGEDCERIAIDPDDPTQVYVASTAGLLKRPTSGSTATWNPVTGGPLPTAVEATDIVVAGTGASKRFYAAFVNDFVYSSPDGATWTQLSSLPLPARTVLGVAPSDPSVVYALGSDNSVNRLAAGTFQPVSGVPSSLAYWGTYALAIAVDPADPNLIYVGGLVAYRATVAPSGPSFTMTPTLLDNVHADVHTIAHGHGPTAGSLDATNVWIGCDGGIWHSSASGSASSFHSAHEGLAVTELNFIGQRYDTDAVVYGGSQDNGTVRCFGEPAWYWALGGDGGGVAVDPNDGNRVMRTYIRSVLSATSDAAAGTWTALNFPPKASPTQQNDADNEGSMAKFASQIATSPAGVTPTRAAFGTNRVWLTDDWGSTWVTLPTGTNPYTPAGVDTAQDVLDSFTVESIAFASGTRLYAATWHGVWRFDRSGTTWTRTPITTTGLPAAMLFITDIAVHDAAAGSFYVSLGWSGVDHCWFFDGSAWHSAGLTAATLDAPAHSVVVDPAHPENVYLGTDVGCFRGRKTGATSWVWDAFSQGLPESAITDLAVHETTRLLRAATYGRGVWERALDAASTSDPDLYLRVDYADTGRIAGGARLPFVEGAEDPTRRGAHVYHWMSPDIKVRRPSLPMPPMGTPPNFFDFAFFVGDYVDSNDTETADVTGTNHVFVQVHNRGATQLPGSQIRVLLLVTDAYMGLPPLPATLATQLNAGNMSASWLAGTQWRFADPANPYRSPPGTVDARNPGIVDFPLDVTGLSLPTGHDHVCAAAFVTTTTAADQFTSTETSMDTLTMHDKHAAHRNLHLVALGAKPVPPGGGTAGDGPVPRVSLLDLHNAHEKERELEVVFDRHDVEGPIAVFAPRIDLEADWKRVSPADFDRDRGDYLRCWVEEARRLLETGEAGEPHACLEPQEAGPEARKRILTRLGRLDLEWLLIVPEESGVPGRIRLGAGEETTFGLVVLAAAGEGPHRLGRLDAIARAGRTITGGSSYFVTQ